MQFTLQALSGTLIGLDETFISGTLGLNHGGTNNENLTCNSGDLYYGDGSKIQALEIGEEGQSLLISGGMPAWGNLAAGGLTVETGTWSLTLVARNAGTVLNQVTYGAEYAYFPEAKLCCISLAVSFGGSGFNSTTVIDTSSGCLPHAMASGNKGTSYIGIVQGNCMLNTVDYNRVVGLMWDGSAIDRPNSMSFYNPGGATQYTAGGWSNTSNKINLIAWYPTAS